MAYDSSGRFEKKLSVMYEYPTHMPPQTEVHQFIQDASYNKHEREEKVL